MVRRKMIKHKFIALLGMALCVATAFVSPVSAQTPIGSSVPKPSADTAMIFQPSRPLLTTEQELSRQYPNSWGLTASFSDYGFGGGLYFGHAFNQDFSALLSVDLGTAEGAQEIDLLEVNKVNRIFVIPVMANLQYRVFRTELSDNLRPYLSVGAGPVVAMTTPYNEDFFSAFGDGHSKIIPGGFVGVGANFGTDPKSNFGASLRYFIIPYPGTLESTSTESLGNLSGLFLTVIYGFNF